MADSGTQSEEAQQRPDVALHYNAIPEVGLEKRTECRIFYLRNFNNWAKSMQIGDVMDKIRSQNGRQCKVAVLDMCCGKGGDLLKWKKSDISTLVCADIADVSLQQAKARYEDMIKFQNQYERRSQPLFSAEFINCDLSKARLKDLLSDPKTEFDVCSCQFSLHYSFSDESSAKCILRNACESLKPGGYFIGTIPNANQVLYLARQNPSLSFSNEVCSFNFELGQDASNDVIPLFSAKYHFTLDEVVNLPEYLIYFPLLIELLKDYGMELVYQKTFSDIVDDKASGQGKGLMERMQALEPFPADDDGDLMGKSKMQYDHAERKIRELKDDVGQSDRERDRRPIRVGTLSKAEWEVASLYMAFAFRKSSDPINDKSS